MKLLIDHSVSGRTAARLRSLGREAVSASEIGMAGASDSELIGLARREGRVIVTLDSDFHQISVLESLTLPSTILIREKEPSSLVASSLVHEICSRFEAELLAGCLLTCTTKYVRLRALPIRKSQS